MTDKQIIIDEIETNPNDWLEPYKPIPACEIKDCNHLVYAGNNVYGCRIAEDGLVCDDFNNDDECCMYRQLEYYKEAIKAKEQEYEQLKNLFKGVQKSLEVEIEECSKWSQLETEARFELVKTQQQLDRLKAEVKSKTEYIQEQRDIINQYSKEIEMYKKCQGKRASKREEELKAENKELKKQLTAYIKEAEENFEVYTTLKDNYRKLYQTLTEIKEIAEICINQDICTFCDYSDKCYIEDEEIPTYDVCKLILQKISECEVNDE